MATIRKISTYIKISCSFICNVELIVSKPLLDIFAILLDYTRMYKGVIDHHVSTIFLFERLKLSDFSLCCLSRFMSSASTSAVTEIF